jgi:predicted RecA/RadA family phage recombinase
MKNFVQAGDSLTIAAPADTLSGAGVRAGVLFGVAQHTALSGAPLSIATRGVFTLPKTSAQAWTLGAAIYFIPATGLCTTATTTGNLLIGVAAEAAVNPSATGVVMLNGAAPAAVTP